MTHWSNWSGELESNPARIERPRDEAAIQALVAEATARGENIRVVGSAHSHSPLVPTTGLMLDLEGLAGVREVDEQTMTARLGAGTRIHALGQPLRAHGVALHNQGDIDRQSIAGALATGTHGTGPTLQNLSASLRAARIVLADGEVATCSAAQNSDLWQAMRLNLGALGVVTEIELSVRTSYRLEERMWLEAIDSVLEKLPELTAATRHFEFFWLPGKPRVACKSLDETDAPPRTPLGLEGARLSWSDQVLANERDEKHIEMEYSLPVESAASCFRALRLLIERRFANLAWPLEYRTLAQDDIWMSSAYQRETVTLSVHQGVDQPHGPLFDACEEIFRSFDGRPHWGKVHGLCGRDLADLHPRWSDWWRVRNATDPGGVFLNEYLQTLRGDPSRLEDRLP